MITETFIHDLVTATKDTKKTKLKPRLINFDHLVVCKSVYYKDLEKFHDYLLQNFDPSDFLFITYYCTSKKGVEMRLNYLPDRRFTNLCYHDWCDNEIDKEQSTCLASMFDLGKKKDRNTNRSGVILKFKDLDSEILVKTLGLDTAFKSKNPW